jgi:hypothetical protein
LTNKPVNGTWETEDSNDDLDDTIDAENINPEIPEENWDSLVWLAIKAAIEVSETKEAVLRKVKKWNVNNDPPLPEKEVVQKVLWALRKWDSKFHRT